MIMMLTYSSAFWIVLGSIFKGSSSQDDSHEFVQCPGSTSRTVSCDVTPNDVISVTSARLVNAFGSNHCNDSQIVPKVTSNQIVACAKNLMPFSRCHGKRECTIGAEVFNGVIFCGVYLRNPNIFYMKYACVTEEETTTTSADRTTESTTTEATTAATTTQIGLSVTLEDGIQPDVGAAREGAGEGDGGTNGLLIGLICGALGGILISALVCTLFHVCRNTKKIKSSKTDQSSTKTDTSDVTPEPLATLNTQPMIPYPTPVPSPPPYLSSVPYLAQDIEHVPNQNPLTYGNFDRENTAYDYLDVAKMALTRNQGDGLQEERLGNPGNNVAREAGVRESRDSGDYITINESTYQPLDGVTSPENHYSGLWQ